ncbi:jg5040 [Pararge aegeria aegeria]|uniref:Jg5040 protein n=1 Tax=Pararge aegeria aegeria TaxID=348720 RepID=A0A8S4SB32_9NEOP|nr:jg5040 [Pararge aegeria aegeria]
MHRSPRNLAHPESSLTPYGIAHCASHYFSNHTSPIAELGPVIVSRISQDIYRALLGRDWPCPITYSSGPGLRLSRSNRSLINLFSAAGESPACSGKLKIYAAFAGRRRAATASDALTNLAINPRLPHGETSSAPCLAASSPGRTAPAPLTTPVTFLGRIFVH